MESPPTHTPTRVFLIAHTQANSLKINGLGTFTLCKSETQSCVCARTVLARSQICALRPSEPKCRNSLIFSKLARLRVDSHPRAPVMNNRVCVRTV